MGYYLTTAIAYPNGAIHIGHAYEYIAADTIARFKRLDNHDVFFCTGTDEHGLKMLQAANKLGITPKELADDNAKNFRDTQLALGSTFDRFIRTTDEDHYAASKAIWRKLEDAGDIYLDTYSGWYSVRDEAFYTEEETEVVDGVRLSKETRTEVTWTEEESYFFRLSKYQDKLLELYKNHPEFIGPDSRRNEIASFVASGLKEAISLRRESGPMNSGWFLYRIGYAPGLLSEVPETAAAVFRSPISRLTRGRKLATALAELVSPLSESYAESRAAFNLHVLGLHDFAQQVDIWEEGYLLTRLDFLLRDDRVAIYVDGTQKYVDGGFDVMSKESRQQNRLLSMGYRVVRFTFNEVLEPKSFGQKLFRQVPDLRSRCRDRLVF